MDRRPGLIIAIVALVLGALWLGIASLVFVWRAGLLPAYSEGGRLSLSILWAWWSYLGYQGANAERAEHLLRVAGLVPLVVLGLGWVVWRRVRPEKAKPLHGETRFASGRELRRSGFYTERPGDYGE